MNLPGGRGFEIFKLISNAVCYYITRFWNTAAQVQVVCYHLGEQTARDGESERAAWLGRFSASNFFLRPIHAPTWSVYTRDTQLILAGLYTWIVLYSGFVGFLLINLG